MMPLLLILTSCGTISTKGVGVYGAFCGKGRPIAQEDANKADVIDQLSAIEPYDYIDCTCKEHDKCYARRGKNDAACDALMDYLLDERALNRWCRNVAFDVQAYFDYIHPSNKSIASHILLGIAYIPARLVFLPFDTIEYAQAHKSGEINNLCMHEPEKIPLWMSTWEKWQNKPSGYEKKSKYKKRVERSRYRASNGSCRAMTELGLYHDWGLGVNRNRQHAIEYYQKAAKCGDKEAYYYLGHKVLMGEINGGEKKALTLFRKCKSQSCIVMADMLLYKQKYIDISKTSSHGKNLCSSIGSTNWLRKWSSSGPSFVY